MIYTIIPLIIFNVPLKKIIHFVKFKKTADEKLSKYDSNFTKIEPSNTKIYSSLFNLVLVFFNLQSFKDCNKVFPVFFTKYLYV